MLGTSDALNNYLVTWPCYKVVIITHYSFQMQSGKIPEPNQHSARQRVKGGAPSENQSERFSLPEKHFILNNCPVKPQGCPLVRAEAPAQSSKWAHRDLPAPSQSPMGTCQTWSSYYYQVISKHSTADIVQARNDCVYHKDTEHDGQQSLAPRTCGARCGPGHDTAIACPGVLCNPKQVRWNTTWLLLLRVPDFLEIQVTLA